MVMVHPGANTLFHLPTKPPAPQLHLHLYLHSFPSHQSQPSLSPRPPTPSLLRPLASYSDIEMFRGRDGVYTARDQKVTVLWDLDNKPPRGPPFDAAVALRSAAELFGRVVDMSAYANRHAFLHLPQWVLHERHDRRRLDALERKGLVAVEDPYVCGVCGRKFGTNHDLKKHFRQLHVRERQKKLNRMHSLKGKKRHKYRERFISGNTKYEEAARTLLTPRTGYGLAVELRRAGVFVKTVEDKPQAADWAVKRQMQHSMNQGIDCLVLVSDDSGFIEMVRRARGAGLRTVVVGDARNNLGRQADLWGLWKQVESGEMTRDMFVPGLKVGEEEEKDYSCGGSGDGSEGERLFESATYYQGDGGGSVDLDCLVDEILVGNSQLDTLQISSFTEQEMNEGANAGDFLWDSEDEEDDYYI